MAPPKVSVVVPVYNTERYLPKCLDTLVSQTLEEIEILVVNDGSPDDSQRIIDSYAALYPDKIVPLLKPNGGLSDARNYGAHRASGEYIGFVDSDDYVEPDMYEALYNAAASSGTRLAMGQYIHYGLNEVTSIQGVMAPEGRDVYRGTDFLLQQTSMVVWNKLYHHSLIKDFPFPNTWFEDVAWTPVIMTHVDKFAYVRKPFYHYIRREDSIASSHHDPRTLQGIESLRTALANSAPDKQDAVVYMAARRLLFEARVRKCYADKYLAAFADIAPRLRTNRYFLEDDHLRARCHTYINELKVIPKRIYYAQFGNRPLTATQEQCVRSWASQLVYGDGEVVKLDESNCDIAQNPTIAEQYERGAYELVGDYFKLKAVLEAGGIALSQNILGHDFISPVLIDEAFFSQTPDDRVFSGAYGAVAGQSDLQAVLDTFLRLIGEGRGEADSVLQEALEAQLRHKYGALLDGLTRRIAPRVTLYGSGTFHSKYDQDNIAVFVPDQEPRHDLNEYRVYTTAYVDTLVRDRSRLVRENRSLQRRLRESERRLQRMRSSYRWRLAWRLGALERSRLLTFLVQLRQERMVSNDEAEQLTIRRRYAKYVDKCPLDHRLVLLESFYGRGLLSNPVALFEAWKQRSDFGQYQFLWVLDDLDNHTQTTAQLASKHPNVSFVERGSEQYYKGLATAKYLINDVTFYFDFVKKPGQVYLNPWHSVSVKSLGYDIPQEPLNQKNVVRNFLATDFFAAANEFVRDRVFLRAHLMEGLFPGKILEAGHPRNDLTFSTRRDEAVQEIRSAGIELDPSKKNLIFAPTWRGSSVAQPTDDLHGYASALAELNASVGDRYNVLIRLHHAAHANLALTDRMRKVAIPPTIDANRMFAATDLLITDYSSIFFDYLVTNRPVLFYIPDLEEYRHSRGVYFDISELPGPALAKLDDLVLSVEQVDQLESIYLPKREEMARWALAWDDGKASQRVLESVLDGSSAKVAAATSQRRNRVLFHAGTLTDQATTSKLQALLTAFNPRQFDISVLVTDSKNKAAQANVNDLLAQGIRVIGRSQHVTVTARERYLLALAERRGSKNLARRLSAAGIREWRRCFGDASFDLAINLDEDPVLVSLALTNPAAGTSIAWSKEAKGGGEPYAPGLRPSFARQYDHVVSANVDFEDLLAKLIEALK
jgi:CDP-glycerol glycerophosphotransferase (TagB/SpsB family)/glycosyltransferase involved in cell wall biosynthesis